MRLPARAAYPLQTAVLSILTSRILVTFLTFITNGSRHDSIPVLFQDGELWCVLCWYVFSTSFMYLTLTTNEYKWFLLSIRKLQSSSETRSCASVYADVRPRSRPAGALELATPVGGQDASRLACFETFNANCVMSYKIRLTSGIASIDCANATRGQSRSDLVRQQFVRGERPSVVFLVRSTSSGYFFNFVSPASGIAIVRQRASLIDLAQFVQLHAAILLLLHVSLIS
jgi:hypothetical protein